MGKGYDSLEVIYTLLSYNEFKHQMILELKDNSNKALLIGDDFASLNSKRKSRETAGHRACGVKMQDRGDIYGWPDSVLLFSLVHFIGQN